MVSFFVKIFTAAKLFSCRTKHIAAVYFASNNKSCHRSIYQSFTKFGTSPNYQYINTMENITPSRLFVKNSYIKFTGSKQRQNAFFQTGRQRSQHQRNHFLSTPIPPGQFDAAPSPKRYCRPEQENAAPSG